MIAMPDPASSTPAEPSPASGQAASESGFAAGRRAAMVQALGGMQQPQPGSPPGEVVPVVVDPVAPVEAPKPAPDPRADEAAAIRKQEVHLRKQLAEERAQMTAEFAREQAALKPKLDEYEQWQQLKAAAKDDVLAYLKAGGFTEADFDHVGRFVYAHGSEGAKDPKNKAMVHQTKAQRDEAAKVAKLEERLASFERQQEEQAARAREQAQLDGFFSTVTKAVSDSSPIVRARLANAPEHTRARLLDIAERLFMESGDDDRDRKLASGESIIQAFEAERRAELEADIRAMGLDPAVVLRPPAPVTPAPAGAAPRSTTLTPGGGASPTQVSKPGRKSHEFLVAEVRRLHATAKP